MAVRNTIDKLIGQALPSGNFPEYLNDSSSDKSISFTHGATGALYLFCEAFDQFQEPKYLDVAKECGEAIWYRCLVKDINSLSTGITGNVYALLCLY